MMESSGLSRRTLLKGSVMVGSATLLGRAATAQAACGADPTRTAGRPEKAVSLRQVSESLAAGRPVRLEGFTRLDGYVIDEDNKDVAIYGVGEPGQPELRVEDFVVALRSKFRTGVDTQNVADYSKSPAISLDPDPDVFQRLNKITTFTPQGQKQYADVCAAPQTVRVDGFQRHTRIAKILVDADYRMKKVGAGLEPLKIPSRFLGDTEAIMGEWRQKVAAGGKDDLPTGVTRYWFTPGRFTHGEARESRNMIRFGLTQVVLKDEDETYSAAGHVPTGKVNPYARAFTCAWTERMEDTYRAEPLWQEMRNIFRWFALARVMRDLDAFAQAGLDPEFLVERYQVPRVQMPATLPGISRVELATSANGTKFTRMFCGGVDVGFSKPLEKEEDRDGQIQLAGQSVLGSRPDSDKLAWNVTRSRLFGP